MSGDGVEDVTIPSVLMKKVDVHSLLGVSRQSQEPVVVRLSPVAFKKEEEEGVSGEEVKEIVDGVAMRMKDGVLRVDATAVKDLSVQVQKLLAAIDDGLVSEEFKNSVSQELELLRAYAPLRDPGLGKQLGDEVNSGAHSSANPAHQDLQMRFLNSEVCSAESADAAEERTQGSESDGG
jgi:hypothetical protein